MTEQVNDSQVVDHTPSEEVVTAEAAPAETSESAAPPVEDTASSTDEKQPESKPAEKTFTQSELDDILQKRLAKEHRKLERQARLEVENEYLRKQQAQPQPQVQQPVQEASGEPKPENFQTYEDYIEAVTDWKVEAKLNAKLQSLQEQSQQRKQQTAQASHEATIAEKLSKGDEKYDDFDEVVRTNPKLQVTIAMRDAIGDSEISEDIAYYLGTHTEESASIAGMTIVQQIKAIERLEKKLTAPAQIPRVSQAPKPADLVGKGRVPSSVNLETANAAEYEKARLKDKPLWAYR
jgi:hypothetical protein